MKLTKYEMDELIAEFKDLINYESEDPCEAVNPLTYVTPDGDTCLHIAALRGNLRAVELLIKAAVSM
jgi:ankyrin repeat protein